MEEILVAEIRLALGMGGLAMMVIFGAVAVFEFTGEAAQLHGEQGREEQQHHGRQEDVAPAQHGLLEFPGWVEKITTP